MSLESQMRRSAISIVHRCHALTVPCYHKNPSLIAHSYQVSNIALLQFNQNRKGRVFKTKKSLSCVFEKNHQFWGEKLENRFDPLFHAPNPLNFGQGDLGDQTLFSWKGHKWVSTNYQPELTFPEIHKS